MRTVTIVGVGRVGGTFALALARAGYEIKYLVSRDSETLRQFAENVPGNPVAAEIGDPAILSSDAVFITTQDSNIKKTASDLVSGGSAGEGFAFHASGALTHDELSPLSRAGRQTGSIHPLVSISGSDRGSDDLIDAYFAIEGGKEAVAAGHEIVTKLGGKPFEIESKNKALYHAAAVVACGHLVALIDTSRKMLENAGLDKETARSVLNPLIESTFANLRESEASDVLTGPFARADLETVQRHLQKIRELADKDIEDVYRLLGRISLELRASNGDQAKRLDEIRKIIINR